MKNRDPLPEDLSVLARRGALSPAELRRFEVYASASPVTAWLHRLGSEYDATRVTEPGDQALLERAVEKACARRTSARASLTRLRLRTLVAAVLACTASAALAGAGVLHWTRSSGAPSGSDPRAAEPPKRGATGASGAAISPPHASAPIPSTQPEALEPSTAGPPTGPGAPLETAFVGRAASGQQQGPAELFSLANELRKAGKTGEAIAAYRRLQQEYPVRPEASVSHVLLARILMRHEGPAAAQEQFARYLARHPRGNLAEEALSGSAAAFRALARSEDERRVLETLLSRFPSSIYAGAARERLDELD